MKIRSLSLALAITMLTAGSVSAARPQSSHSSIPTGNDVSWPQCGKTLPTGSAFGVVGVNDGLANNTNPCFATEYSWALNTSGSTAQPKAQVYVNTADPGSYTPTVSDWPTSDTDVVTGGTDANPYGSCTGGDTVMCSWQYGYNEANLDANSRNVANPGSLVWWLDVETGNTWTTNAQDNQADLQAMTTYLESIGAKVGLYSTSSQWKQLMGTVPSTSNLNGLASWIPGARTVSGAESNCSLSPLTANGFMSITQYVSGGLDYDVSCL